MILLAVGQAALCQTTKKMRENNVLHGSIILKGKPIEGYIKSKGKVLNDDEWMDAPWQFQGKLQFIAKDIFDNKDKIKNKDFNKYGAKDIDGYHYNGDSLAYESVKYVDMSAVGTGMIPKSKFMRKMESGKINLYIHFQSPPAAMVGSTEDFRRTYEECAVPEPVYQKGEKAKLKLVNGMNVKKVLADCPDVVKKFEGGEYGVIETKSESKLKGLAKLANKTTFRDDMKINAIKDYNQSCQ